MVQGRGSCGMICEDQDPGSGRSTILNGLDRILVPRQSTREYSREGCRTKLLRRNPCPENWKLNVARYLGEA